MKVLHELERMIDFRKINVLGRKSDDIEALFNLLREGPGLDDDQAKAHFYPGSRHAKRYLNRIKQLLRRRIVNTLFCTETHLGDYWDVYWGTAKKALVVDLLGNRGRARAAARIAAEVVREAEQFHFSRLGADVCLQMMGHYSIARRDLQKYRHYQELYRRFQEIDRWEQRAEAYYYELALELRHLKTVSERTMKLAEQYHQELAGVGAEQWSMKFVLFRCNIDLLLYQLKNDITGMITTGEAALAYFDELEFTVPGRALRSAYFNLIPATLQTEEYEKADRYLSLAQDLVSTGTHNWIALHQYQVILGFRRQDLEQVATSITAIRMSDHHTLIAEELRIYETYLDFLQGEIPRLGKFLNETIHYSSDKKGMNINILILQVLIYLQREDRPAIIERLEALQAYAYRYLTRDPAMRRSELFFRLLFLLARSAFDLEEVYQRAPDLLGQLKSATRHISSIDIEVVPYAILWDRVVAICKKI